jgi:hypothetical protein
MSQRSVEKKSKDGLVWKYSVVYIDYSNYDRFHLKETSLYYLLSC